jgi:hypothetical protein
VCKQGLLPVVFFVVVGGVIVGAALVPVPVPLFPVGVPLPDDGAGLLALPAPLLSLLPGVDEDGELLL